MSFAEFLYYATVWGIQDVFEGGAVQALLARVGESTWAPAVIIGVAYLICIAVAYLLGSVNTALIISRYVFHDDVREHGSGNAGTTNVLRTYGKKAAALTFLGDMLKGIVAILVACALFGAPDTALEGYFHLLNAVYLAGFFVIFGHVFPCFSQFRGGKGFATMVGVLLSLNPFLFLLLFIVYVPLVLCSHYISLSSVVMALFYPMLLSIVDQNFRALPHGISTIITVAIGVLITWAHRTNLKRIYEGNERKFYLGKKKTVQSAPAAQEREQS